MLIYLNDKVTFGSPGMYTYNFPVTESEISTKKKATTRASRIQSRQGTEGKKSTTPRASRQVSVLYMYGDL